MKRHFVFILLSILILCFSSLGFAQHQNANSRTGAEVDTAIENALSGVVLLDSTPSADDSWSGPEAEYLAGETLAQWDLVYIAHDAGTPEIKKWDADLASVQDLKPVGVVIESGGISDTSTGTVGVGVGIGRNDGWSWITNNQDEGKTVYGSDTAGVLTDDISSFVATDIVCAVGTVLDDFEIQFNFGLCATVEVP